MSETVLSVGIDLGTTTTQMVVSRLYLENTAAPFTVPRMEIQKREILYQSRPYLTPLKKADTLDSNGIKNIIQREYDRAGIRPEQVQTGAVIITGETARKENAETVLHSLSEMAGEFVVSTAGPALESVLAARGAGADRYAADHAVPVLHIDIGGGTSNFALFGPDGCLLDTGCLNVGGRLIRYDKYGAVEYVSPVLSHLAPPKLGQTISEQQLFPIVNHLVEALEEASGLRPVSESMKKLLTDKAVDLQGLNPVISFSGGVADHIAVPDTDWTIYGDLGVLLGRQIRNSKLCSGRYVLGKETIRATVIGAGSYATALSGSTVYYENMEFPVHDLPVAVINVWKDFKELQTALQKKLSIFDPEPAAVFLKTVETISYGDVAQIADTLELAFRDRNGPMVVILQADMAKALGQALRCRIGKDRALICLDGLHIPPGSYLDLHCPVGNGSAVPVVVKTLAF